MAAKQSEVPAHILDNPQSLSRVQRKIYGAKKSAPKKASTKKSAKKSARKSAKKSGVKLAADSGYTLGAEKNEKP